MFRKALSVIFRVILVCSPIVVAMRLSPSQFLASMLPQKTTVVWQTEPRAAYSTEMRQTVFADKGNTVVSVGDKIRTWDVATGALKSVFPYSGRPWEAYSPDGKQYAHHTFNSYGRDETLTQVQLHDARNRKLLQTFPFPRSLKERRVIVDQVVFPSTGNLFNVNYTLSPKPAKNRRPLFSEIYTVWDRQTQKQIASRTRKVNESTRRGYFQDPFFSPDGQRLWLLETDETDFSSDTLKVNLTDLLQDKKVATFNLPEKEYGSLYQKWDFACVSPLGSQIVAINSSGGAGSSYGTLFIFDTKTQRVLWWQRVSNFTTKALVFSPDGKYLAWAGTNYNRFPMPNHHSAGKVLLLDPQTGKNIMEVTERRPLDFLKQMLMIGSQGTKALLGAKPKSNGIREYIPGETPDIGSLAFSPDSKKLAVGYADGSIKLWKIQ